MKTQKLPIKVCFIRYSTYIYILIKSKFGKYENLQFKKLLNADRFPEIKERFPEKVLNYLLKKYSRYFVSIKLWNKLTALLSAPDAEVYT